MDRCVIGPECEERVRRCWCEGKAWMCTSPVCVPARRWVEDKDKARAVIGDLKSGIEFLRELTLWILHLDWS